MTGKIRQANPKELIQTAIIDQYTDRNSTTTPVFNFGQVINVKDNLDSNRIKIRIPLLDNSLYYDNNGKLQDTLGDDKLPWCVSALGRYVETPEINSTVLVALLDPSLPFSGRIWFPVSSPNSGSGLFNSLGAEIQGNDSWSLLEKKLGIIKGEFPNENGNQFQQKQSTINFKIGIRGKSNNKLLFDEKSTLLIQDEGKETESKLTLSSLVELKGKNLDILSTNSSKTQRPAFADPLFDYLSQVQEILISITTLLLAPGTLILPIPGMVLGPNPMDTEIITNVQQALQTLTNLKIPGNGKSEYIKIN
jgi:hypothetical protein